MVSQVAEPRGVAFLISCFPRCHIQVWHTGAGRDKIIDNIHAVPFSPCGHYLACLTCSGECVGAGREE